MRAYGTDTTRRMYFTEYAIAAPEEVSYCVVVPKESQGAYVETLPAVPAVCIYYHGAYEDLPAVGRRLLDYAKEQGLTPLGTLRHTYPGGAAPAQGPRQVHHPGQPASRVRRGGRDFGHLTVDRNPRPC